LNTFVLIKLGHDGPENGGSFSKSMTVF